MEGTDKHEHMHGEESREQAKDENCECGKPMSECECEDDRSCDCDERAWLLMKAVKIARFEIAREKAKKLLLKTEGKKIDRALGIIVKLLSKPEISDKEWEDAFARVGKAYE